MPMDNFGWSAIKEKSGPILRKGRDGNLKKTLPRKWSAPAGKGPSQLPCWSKMNCGFISRGAVFTSWKGILSRLNSPKMRFAPPPNWTVVINGIGGMQPTGGHKTLRWRFTFRWWKGKGTFRGRWNLISKPMNQGY